MMVMKFGGTSVESAEAIGRVAGIVESRLERHPVVVVSAMGKTTNKLLAMAETAVAGDKAGALEQWEALRTSHLREASGLGIDCACSCRRVPLPPQRMTTGPSMRSGA